MELIKILGIFDVSRALWNIKIFAKTTPKLAGKNENTLADHKPKLQHHTHNYTHTHTCTHAQRHWNTKPIKT